MINARGKVIAELQQLSGHLFVELTDRGNSAITAALSIFSPGGKILIPSEGGWIHYKKGPEKLKLKVVEVGCDNARINIKNLQEKLKTGTFSAFLYQNPGGYFAEQPMKEIYDLCRAAGCLVILDVSGSIGTELCDGRYADIMVGSFGEGKLVEAKGGGFISCRDAELWSSIEEKVKSFDDPPQVAVILRKLEELPERICFLQEKRKKILRDLSALPVIYPQDTGFVVVVSFSNPEEKESIINYCHHSGLPFTECPRYIRVQRKAISIEVKQVTAEKRNNQVTR